MPQKRTELNVGEIRARCHRASRGPWVHFADGYVERAGDPGGTIGVTCFTRPDTGEGLPAVANAEFIAHARTDVPLLLDELDRLRKALSRIARGEVEFPEEFADSILNGPQKSAPSLVSARHVPPHARG